MSWKKEYITLSLSLASVAIGFVAWRHPVPPSPPKPDVSRITSSPQTYSDTSLIITGANSKVNILKGSYEFQGGVITICK